LRAYARDELKLKPSHTAYMSWGKGRRQPLRFSKYGEPHLEALFSTHYVSHSLAATKTAQRAQVATEHPSRAPGPA
jgi:hypothetical protein